MGELARVQVRGWRGLQWTDPLGTEQLRLLNHGEVPPGWVARSATTEEVTFLAPLETVSARGRARRLFDFDYIWEVYVPAAKRRWGYYTLQILHGDRLRARADLKVDPKTRTLRVLGFWLEDPKDARDPVLAPAVARGLVRLQGWTGAETWDLAGIRPSSFRALVAKGV